MWLFILWSERIRALLHMTSNYSHKKSQKPKRSLNFGLYVILWQLLIPTNQKLHSKFFNIFLNYYNLFQEVCNNFTLLRVGSLNKRIHFVYALQVENFFSTSFNVSLQLNGWFKSTSIKFHIVCEWLLGEYTLGWVQ